MTIPRRHKRHWTAPELRLLKQLCEAGIKLDKISRDLERTEGSVERKAIALGYMTHQEAPKGFTRESDTAWD